MIPILSGVAATLLLGAALVGWWLRRRFLLVTVDGRSMEPGHRHGDRVLVDRQRTTTIRVGDIVVIDQSGGPDQTLRTMIKRVAALSGDQTPPEVCAFQHWPPRTRVPADHLVLLGANPTSSLDSRQRGFFPTNQLLGVVVRHLRTRNPTQATLTCEKGTETGPAR